MQARPPVRPLVELLPLDEIDEYRFQSFCTELAAHAIPESDPFQYGRRGDEQEGIDVVVPTRSGTTWAFQSRRVRRFGPAAVAKTVADTTFEADRYVILLSSEASAGARREVRKHPKWQVWDLRDISRRVRELPRPVAWRMVATHFGPAWPEQFLVGGPEPLLVDTDEFFDALLERTLAFQHGWSLVGRSDELSRLVTFAKDDGARVGLLLGRGGIGKTRLLRAFAAEVPRAGGPRVQFISERTRFDIASLHAEILPNSIVVIDDAHRREDLEDALRALRDAANVKVLLAARPWARTAVQATVMRSFDPRELLQFPTLGELGPDEVRALAEQALGPARRYAERLVTVSADSPLVTVVGGRLVAEGSVDPALMDRDQTFRRAVFLRLEEDLVRPIASRIGEPRARELMDLLAAIGPIRLEDRALVGAASAFLGISAPTFIATVGLLEDGGILARRGRLLRITPDVLADHVLHRACVTAAGTPTGFAELVFDALGPITSATIVANVAELDWRQQQAGGADVFEGVWRRLVEQAGQNIAHGVVSQLEPIAHLQPGRVLELIEHTFRAGTGDGRPTGRTGDDLARLLRGVGYSLEHLPRVLDLLWVVGRDDARPTNPHPDHPIRVLEDIAKYGAQKPVGVGGLVIEAVRRWITDEGAFGHAHSPLEILDPLLEKSGYDTGTVGASIQLSGFIIDERRVRAVRNGALEILGDLGRRDDLRVRLRVVESLRDALREPLGYFGQPVADEARAQWHDEERRVLEMLAGMVGLDPVIDMKIRDALDWHCRYRGSDAVRERAREIAASITATSAYRRAIVLSTHWDVDLLLPFDVDLTAGGHEEGLRMMVDLQASVADEIVAAATDSRDSMDLVVEDLRRLEAAGVMAQPGQFLAVLSRRHPAYAVRICRDVVREPLHPLSAFFAALVDGVASANPDEGVALVREALAHRNERALASVAFALGGGDWRRAAGIWGLVSELSRHPSRWVRHRTIFAIHSLGDLDRPRAARLLAGVDFEDDAELADEVFTFVNEKRLDLGLFTDEEIDDWLRRLDRLDEIDGYWVREFIEAASFRRPGATAKLFVRRCAVADERGPRYRPLPGEERLDLGGLRDRPERAELLREVREGVLRPPGLRKYLTTQLFGVLSLGYDDESLRVLDEWIASGDPEHIVGAALLLQGAHWRFVFEQEAFVARALLAAAAAGETCYRRTAQQMLNVATSGMWQGSPGQPAPRHVEQRERAALAAERHTSDSPVRRFYEAVRDDAVGELESERVRDEEEFGV